MVLSWTAFIIPPMSQQIAGALASASEIAHSFRIEANSVANAFIEFTDFYGASSQIIQPYYEKLILRVSKEEYIDFNYCDLFEKYRNYREYAELKEVMYKELFWVIREYEIDLKVKYENKEKIFKYKFDISKDVFEKLENNILKTCDFAFKSRYGKAPNYNTINVKIGKVQ